jgi:hypothetical protein
MWNVIQIFERSILFRGDSNTDQVKVIMECVGSQEVELYIKKYSLKVEQEIIGMIHKCSFPKKPWASFTNKKN